MSKKVSGCVECNHAKSEHTSKSGCHVPISRKDCGGRVEGEIVWVTTYCYCGRNQREAGKDT